MEKKFVAQLQPVGCSAGFEFAAAIAEWVKNYDGEQARRCTVYNAYGQIVAVLLRGPGGRWFIAEGSLPNDLIEYAFDNVLKRRALSDPKDRKSGAGKHLMNPYTGTVQTRRRWEEDFQESPPELWGGDKFDDAVLLPVPPPYCTQNGGDCGTCSLTNYGRNCRNFPVRRGGTG